MGKRSKSSQIGFQNRENQEQESEKGMLFRDNYAFLSPRKSLACKPREEVLAGASCQLNRENNLTDVENQETKSNDQCTYSWIIGKMHHRGFGQCSGNSFLDSTSGRWQGYLTDRLILGNTLDVVHQSIKTRSRWYAEAILQGLCQIPHKGDCISLRTIPGPAYAARTISQRGNPRYEQSPIYPHADTSTEMKRPVRV